MWCSEVTYDFEYILSICYNTLHFIFLCVSLIWFRVFIHFKERVSLNLRLRIIRNCVWLVLLNMGKENWKNTCNFFSRPPDNLDLIKKSKRCTDTKTWANAWFCLRTRLSLYHMGGRRIRCCNFLKLPENIIRKYDKLVVVSII